MQNYPLPKFQYQVDLVGVTMGFTEVSGLVNESELINMHKFNKLTFKRGVLNRTTDIYHRKNFIAAKSGDPFTGTIKLLNEKNQTVIVWRLKNAFSIMIKATPINDKGKEIGIESLVLAFESTGFHHWRS